MYRTIHVAWWLTALLVLTRKESSWVAVRSIGPHVAGTSLTVMCVWGSRGPIRSLMQLYNHERNISNSGAVIKYVQGPYKPCDFQVMHTHTHVYLSCHVLPQVVLRSMVVLLE